MYVWESMGGWEENYVFKGKRQQNSGGEGDEISEIVAWEMWRGLGLPTKEAHQTK